MGKAYGQLESGAWIPIRVGSDGSLAGGSSGGTSAPADDPVFVKLSDGAAPVELTTLLNTINTSVKTSVGTPIELLNANTGGANNNRTFTVPANKVWQIQSFRISYVASAVVGVRGLRITYETSGGAVLCSQRAGANQSASQTREYAFAAGAPYDSAFGGVSSDYLLVPLPPLLLKAGQVIRFRDPANVSVADAFTINGLAIEWTV